MRLIQHMLHHQYTILLNGVDRDALVNYLAETKIPSMIYYPVPAINKMFEAFGLDQYHLETTDWLTERVILPIHTELMKNS